MIREFLHTKAGRYGVVIGVIAVLLFIVACAYGCSPKVLTNTIEKECHATH